MRIITTEENMKSRFFSSSVMTAACVLLLVAFVPMIVVAQSQPATPAQPAQAAKPATPAALGKAFDTPQAAADAVIKAAADYDVDALMAIFGPDGKDFVSGGDQVLDKNNAIAFGKEAQTKYAISMESAKPGRPVSVVGQNTG